MQEAYTAEDIYRALALWELKRRLTPEEFYSEYAIDEMNYEKVADLSFEFFMGLLEEVRGNT